jgi:hypothetical protein
MDGMETQFFQNVLDAGAIIAGFCGMFLVFRIQREAEYYRGPSYGFKNEQHFTSSFLLIILATLIVSVFGVVFPLFYLSGVRGCWLTPRLVVAGLLAALILLAGYFVDELFHYRILKEFGKEEWKRELPIVVFSFVLCILAALAWLVLTT